MSNETTSKQEIPENDMQQGGPQIPKEILEKLPQLVPLTQGHFSALETALGALGRDIGTALNIAYEAYGIVVNMYLDEIMGGPPPKMVNFGDTQETTDNDEE